MTAYVQLREIAKQIKDCTVCGLCQTRLNAVPGNGWHEARILFVGEGPGGEEDREGSPFVGRAGGLLNEGLTRADLDRSKVFVTNIVKCRPPGNRNPTSLEMNACAGYLKRQIDAIQPDLIVVLGKVAAEYMLQREVKITRENGDLDFLKDGTCVMTVLHPAYVLRNQTPRVREDFFKAIASAKTIALGLDSSTEERMENLEETHKALLELVREGKAYATPRLRQGRRVFVADIYATDEDREFTKVWLQHPHFGLDG